MDYYQLATLAASNLEGASVADIKRNAEKILDIMRELRDKNIEAADQKPDWTPPRG